MPSDLQRVAQGLVECLDQVPQIVAHLQQTAMRLRQQASWIADLSGGNPYGRQAALLLDDAARRCDEAAYRASFAPLKATVWAQTMVGGSGTDEGSGQARPSVVRLSRSGTPSGAGERAEKSAGERRSRINAAAQARIRKLPVRQKDSDKTHGVWIDSEGREYPLVSGHDRYRAQAETLARHHGIRPITTTSHVEIKFAMFMRERGLSNETIYINNEPCSGPWSCEQLLRKFLAPGARLTVHWPDAEPREFEGEG